MATDRYSNSRVVRDLTSGKRNYSTTIFQSIPATSDDVFITTRDGDRLDLLAHRFYGDSTLWWVIAVSNGISESFFVPPGTKLRIPADVQLAFSYTKLINDSR